MSLFVEVIVISCELLASVGKVLFLSIFSLFDIVWEILKILFLFLSNCADLIVFLFSVMTLYFFDFFGLILPHIWYITMFSITFIQAALEYIVNTLALYLLTIWTSPGFVIMRENLFVGIRNGVGELVTILMQNPILAVESILGITWITLFLTYRKELFRLFRRGVDAGMEKIRYLWNVISASARNFFIWTMTPVRVVASLPTKAKESLRSVWIYIYSWKIYICSWRIPFYSRPAPTALAQDGPDPRPTSKTVSKGPSLFRRLQRTDSVESLDRLKDDLRALKTMLEEERETKLCIICQSQYRSIVCMPCKHFATCDECITLLPVNILSRKVCPVCRTQIDTTIKVYL